MANANNMEYTFLGNSGLKVSRICLGAMTFGRVENDPMMFYSNPKQSDEALSHKIMDRYEELGGNFIDTANIYSYGKSEEIIGTWLKKRSRDDVVVATKVRFPMHRGEKNKNDMGLSRRHIVQSLDESLQRLQTDYVDLFQAHIWDNGVPLEETLRTFDDLTRCGKIRYYGYSNLSGWQMQKVVETAKHLNLNKCISLQQQYNLLTRQSETEAFQVCGNEGVGVMTWGPLKAGLLTGKFKKGVAPDNTSSRTGYLQKSKGSWLNTWDRYKEDEDFWRIMSALEKLSNTTGKTIPQIALKWLLQKDVVSSVISGASSVQQLESNMVAGGSWVLSEEEMASLDEASEPKPSYPYEFIWSAYVNKARYNKFNSSSIKF